MDEIQGTAKLFSRLTFVTYGKMEEFVDALSKVKLKKAIGVCHTPEMIRIVSWIRFPQALLHRCILGSVEG